MRADGEIEYLGNGKFEIEGPAKTSTKINLILSGTGITPGYAAFGSSDGGWR